MYRILVCDDEKDIVSALKIYLMADGYQVFEAYNGREALEILKNEDIHLVLMDIMMPEMDGITAMLKIREVSNVPVILLTAKSEDTDKVLGLTVGADDYVTKPFRPLEVVARVKAQLRRYKKYSPATSVEKIQPELSYNKLRLNTQTHECLLDGENVSLTPTEFSILNVLLKNAGTVVSIEDLFHAVWKDEYYSKNSSTITVHIRHLREKLKDTSDTPKYIKTIWGVGYKI